MATSSVPADGSGGEHEQPSFYFIDGNRAYRGPVTKATLHFLLQNQSIGSSTYIFASHIEECSNSWVRLKKIPSLLAELRQPLPPTSTGPLAPAAPSNAPAPASAAAAAPASAAAAEAEPTTAEPEAVPHARTNPTADAAASGAATIWSATPGTGSSTAAAGLLPVEPAARLSDRLSHAVAAASESEREPLFGYFPASAPAAATPRRPSIGHRPERPFRFFSSRNNKAASAAKGGFGQPLHLCSLDADGVPEALSKMRAMLFQTNGHLVEGIFRVSPSVSVLKAARQDAEANHLDRVRDPECLAQLIKVWFRVLPASIFEPCLQPIVDGPPDDGARCAALADALPEPQRSTVRWLLRLFRDVAQQEAENRMTIKSLIVVFAPNLVDPPPTMPPILALELNGRLVTFLERLYEHTKRQQVADIS